MSAGIDPLVAAPVRRLCDDLMSVARGELVGVYVHGSAVLGDFIAGSSDLDLLIVTHDEIGTEALTASAAALAGCDVAPAIGVEASVVTRSAAMAPRAPWPFLIHVTNHPGGIKIVHGRDSDGDPDLALHYAVLRQRSWVAAGAAANDVIGDIDRSTIIAHLAGELRWATEHAPESYTVLNVCRALRFAAEGVLCSKSDGGRWALGRHMEPGLISSALTARQDGTVGPTSERAREWALSVATSLDQLGS